MAKPARVRETDHVRAIHAFHPLFAAGSFVRCNPDEGRRRSNIEGGGIHVLGHGTALIGMGERTTDAAVPRLHGRNIAVILERPRPGSATPLSLH